MVQRESVTNSLTREQDESDWMHLVEAVSILSKLVQTLQTSRLISEYKIEAILHRSLIEAQDVLNELNRARGYLESIMEMARASTTIEQSKQSIKMARISIEESKRVKLRESAFLAGHRAGGCVVSWLTPPYCHSNRTCFRFYPSKPCDVHVRHEHTADQPNRPQLVERRHHSGCACFDCFDRVGCLQ